MLLLKKAGENLVPAGCYTDPTARQTALYGWVDGSLFPFFNALEKAIIDEFRLIPQMLRYEVCVAGNWHTELSSSSVLEEVIRDYIRQSDSCPFQLRLVIECIHPHISWGTVVDLGFEMRQREFDDEVHDCYGFVIEPVWFNLDEQMPFDIGLELVEIVLGELRIIYVQNLQLFKAGELGPSINARDSNDTAT